MWSQVRKSGWIFWMAAALSLAAVASGCNLTPGEGFFEAATFSYGGCERKVLPWQPKFYTIDTFEDQVTIRLQNIGGNLEQVDGIYVRLDRAFVAQNRNQDIPLGPVMDEDGQERTHVDVVMGFYASCPEHGRVVPTLEGTIRFSRFEPYNDGQITATIDAPRVIDARTGDVLGTDLTGEFSFLVQKGRPYSNFTGPNR